MNCTHTKQIPHSRNVQFNKRFEKSLFQKRFTFTNGMVKFVLQILNLPWNVFKSNEEELQDLLLYYNIIDNNTEWIEYTIWLDENDYFDKNKSKITLTPH